MKINMPGRLLLLVCCSLLLYCTDGKKITTNQPSTLKDAFKNDFLIGTALSETQVEEKDPKAAALIPQQFNAATPENIMKAEIIHPEWNRYNFDLADKMIEYGKKNNIRINGHTLISHSQLPAFMRTMKD